MKLDVLARRATRVVHGVVNRSLVLNTRRWLGGGTSALPIDSYDSNISYQHFNGTRGGSDSERKLAAIRLPSLTGKRFLDLGCNAGFFCRHAKDSGAIHVLGVDNSANVVALARKRHPDLSFLDTGWDKFPEGEFDVVICLSAVHYASNQIRLAQEINDHLSNEGLFVLEGGLVGDEILQWTDLPIVAFREVGDRVRHLSTGFLRRHMLIGFDWDVIGASIMQGGDPIPRFVVHARKRESADSSSVRSDFRLCPIEYARALALCASTIQDNQPSSLYVRALGASRAPLSPAHIERVLGDDRAMVCFADDVAYALNAHGTRLELSASLSDAMTSRLAQLLRERNIEVLVSAQATLASNNGSEAVMQRMEAGVEFSREGQSVDRLTEILKHCKLPGTKVADLSGADSGLWRHLLDMGARECHVIVPQVMAPPDRQIRVHVGRPWQLEEDNLDFAFFDATVVADFDHLDDTARLAESLTRCLAPDGLAYLVLRTGITQTDWDVFNQTLLTPLGKLPSSDYLYNVLLRNFAVRPLIRLTDKANSAYSITRIFRVAPRRPTLLVVLGPSQAGKTTLARDLRRIPDAVHLSNDYLFYELFRFKSKNILPNCSQALISAVGGGSAEEVGNFFRAIESDAELFQDYMKLILAMIPRGQNSVSLDLDLRHTKRLDELRNFFTKAGFSVWIVTR